MGTYQRYLEPSDLNDEIVVHALSLSLVFGRWKLSHTTHLKLWHCTGSFSDVLGIYDFWNVLRYQPSKQKWLIRQVPRRHSLLPKHLAPDLSLRSCRQCWINLNLSSQTKWAQSSCAYWQQAHASRAAYQSVMDGERAPGPYHLLLIYGQPTDSGMGEA